ncbi:MAG: ankyrin repeat domain-containing protein [Spirochaetaceae bacterium]|nr:MAG: ankyrin repeat domain-containing protein [Spirochaetaceae bacterium]
MNQERLISAGHRYLAAYAQLRRLTVGVFLFLMLPVPSLLSQTGGPTALHWAAGRGHTEIVLVLIENGAELEALDYLGRTALHLAHRYPSTVQVLLEAGANVNAQDSFGATPLHMGIRIPETIELLINAGAEIDSTDAIGRSPLDLAVRGGSSRRNLRVVTALVEAGAR